MKNNLHEYEDLYFEQGYKLIAGVDEVGRGCLAGPCVVCACILKPGYHNELINDSKKLTDKQRRKLVDEIKANCLCYELVTIPANKVEINVKAAAKQGMVQALKKIKLKPDLALIDFEKIDIDLPTISIVKGDEKSISIAAASILAKVYRDDLLISLAIQYPKYGFEKHKGYGTKKHYEAIEKYGTIKGIHRTSWIHKK